VFGRVGTLCQYLCQSMLAQPRPHVVRAPAEPRPVAPARSVPRTAEPCARNLCLSMLTQVLARRRRAVFRIVHRETSVTVARRRPCVCVGRPTAGDADGGAWPAQARCAKDHWHNSVDGLAQARGACQRDCVTARMCRRSVPIDVGRTPQPRSPLVPNPRWHSADGALEQSPARTAAVIAVSPKRPAIPVTRVSRGRSAGTGRETRLRRATPWRAAPCSWPPTGRAVAVRCCRPTGRARPADGRTRPIVNVHAPRWGPR
jgi:hypothetical protein